jgi:hypothetical protein
MGSYYMPDGALAQYFHAICSTPLTAVQYILCDIICAWRTVVIWHNDKRIVAILAFFILAITGA